MKKNILHFLIAGYSIKNLNYASDRTRTCHLRIRSLANFDANIIQNYSKQKAYIVILLYYKELCN